MSVVNYSEAGSLTISTKAFKDIASVVLSRIEGISPAKNDFVSCSSKENDVKFRISIRISQNLDVVKTCSRIQNMIHESVLEMTGVDAGDIDITVSGFIS